MTAVRVMSLLAVLAAATGVAVIAAQERRLATWHPVPAVVLESVEERYRTRVAGGSRSGRRLKIRYRYFLDEGALEGDGIYPGPWSSYSGEIEALRARFPVGARTRAWVDPEDPRRTFLVPERSFLPYLLILLLAAPLGALAAATATGGVIFLRSGQEVAARPRQGKAGFHSFEAFRSCRALRDAGAAALAVLLPTGAGVFTHFLTRSNQPGGVALLALLAWLALVLRLLGAVAGRTWNLGRLEDGRLSLRPRHPRAGRPLDVAFEQAVRAEARVKAVDLTLVGERITSRLRGGRRRTKRVRVARVRLRLPVGAVVTPAAPLRVEGTWQVPEEARPGDGWLAWRVEARTRLFGPDYVTRFLIGSGGDGA